MCEIWKVPPDRADVALAEAHRATRAAHDRLAFLLEVSVVLSSSLEYRRTVSKVAAMTVPRFSDLCTVDLWDGTRFTECIAVAHADPAKTERLRALRAELPSRFDESVLRSGKARVLPHIGEEDIRAAAQNEAHYERLRTLTPPSLILVPLEVRGAVIGLVSFGSAGRVFDERDLEVAELIGRGMAIAIDNARLLDAVVESEARYRHIVETAQEGILQVTSSRQTTFVNLRMAEMLGYTPDEMFGQDVLDFIPESERNRVAARIENRARGLVPPGESAEFQFRRRDGSTIWGLVTASVIHADDGTYTGIVAMVTDITARKAAADRQRFLAEATPILTGSLDVEATLSKVAHLAVPAIADWAAIELLDADGMPRQLAVAHVDPAKVRFAAELRRRYPPSRDRDPQYWEMLRTGKPNFVAEIPRELLIASAVDEEHLRLLVELGITSGMAVPLLVRGVVVGVLSLVYAESGRRYSEDDLEFVVDLARRASAAIENARLYAAEQSARRDAEEAARRVVRLQSVTAGLVAAGPRERVAEIALETALPATGATGGVIAMLTRDGAFVDVIAIAGFDGAAWETEPRRSIEEPVPLIECIRSGRPVWFETPEDRARYPHIPEMKGREAGIALPLAVGGRVIGGLWLAFPLGTVLRDEDRELMRSIAQQCAHALERAQLLREAQDANRLKDDFLATLSHELRTPLHAILGWLDMVKARPEDESRRRKALDVVERNARAQASLVEDLLDVSRIVNGKFHVTLNPLVPALPVRAAVDAIRPAAEAKGLSLTADLDPDCGAVEGDAARLQQVVSNLLANAVKFTPPGGSIHVTLTQDDREIALRVRDSGAGIPAEFLPHVFDRFRQADSSSTRVHGGMGLGLSIVRHIVDQHGGVIAAESEGAGKGSTFTVRIPRSAVAVGSSRLLRAGTGDLPRLDGIDVLVVDDDADSIEATINVLQGQGASVRSASSSRAALSEIRRRVPRVLLADIGMPGEDGYALIGKVRALPRAKGGAVPAAALTAYASPEDRARALFAGFQSHLAKPMDIPELIAVVASLSRRPGPRRAKKARKIGRKSARKIVRKIARKASAANARTKTPRR